MLAVASTARPLRAFKVETPFESAQKLPQTQGLVHSRISSRRIAASAGSRGPNVVDRPISSELVRSHSSSRYIVASAGPGGNVIDRPTTSPDITKKRETKKRKPPSYRVLLHNDNVNKREYVVQVLLKVVEGYTVEDALNVMQEAHQNGLALVTVCAQEKAEAIVEGMRNSGLVSTMEPAGPSGV